MWYMVRLVLGLAFGTTAAFCFKAGIEVESEEAGGVFALFGLLGIISGLFLGSCLRNPFRGRSKQLS